MTRERVEPWQRRCAGETNDKRSDRRISFVWRKDKVDKNLGKRNRKGEKVVVMADG